MTEPTSILAPVASFLNLPSLEHSPRETYRAFKGALLTGMENELTAYYPLGPLHMVFSDDDWNALNPPVEQM